MLAVSRPDPRSRTTLSRRSSPTNRGRFVQSIGPAGALALAGCTTRTRSPGRKLDPEPNYGGWFEGVSNYGGTPDLRGRDAVGVEVGARGNLGYYKYVPAAIAVSPGTTVEWTWSGKGGVHDVRAENDSFRSATPSPRRVTRGATRSTPPACTSTTARPTARWG